MAEAPTPPTMEFNILLFNVGHGNAKNISTAGITNDQTLGISKVLDVISPPPMFVLSQDTITNTKAKCLQEGLGYQIISGSVSEVDDTGIFHDLRHNPTYSGTIIPQSQFEPFIFLDKLTAWKVLLHGQSVLIVSWHGPYTGWNVNDLQRKKRLFKSLLDSVAKVQTERKADVVVLGGDFNLEMRHAKEAVENCNLWDPPSRKLDMFGSDDSVDFIVTWPSDRVVCLKRIPVDFELKSGSVPEDYSPCVLYDGTECKIPFYESERECEDLPPFDHKRVLFRLRLILDPDILIPLASLSSLSEAFRRHTINER